MEITEEIKNRIFDKPEIGEKNVYDYALEMFVGDDELRDWMHKPFMVDDLAVSTDAHLMCFFNKSLASSMPIVDEKHIIKVREIISIIPDLEIKINVSQIKEKLLLCEFEPEKKRTGKYSTCDVCNGEGEVEWEFSHNAKHYEKEFECPVCEGSGCSEEPIWRPTGNVKFTKYQRCLIHQSHLDCAFVHKLFTVSQLLGVDEVTLISQPAPNKPSLFQVGPVRLIIMPMIFEKKEKTVFEIVNQ